MANKISAEARAALANGAQGTLIISVVDAIPRPTGDIPTGSPHARQQVADSRQAVANASQGALLELLNARGLKPKSLWINNSIVVRNATLALAEELAARDDVREINVDAVHNVVHED